MSVENYPNVADWSNFRQSFVAQLAHGARSVLFRKFAGYEIQGTGLEQFRVPKYDTRSEVVWLSNVKVFDTVKGGYFTTGDLDVNGSFEIRGYSPGYELSTGEKVEEYAGDEIIWNGKVWVVSDQIEPIPYGPRTSSVYWRTVLRRADRSAQGVTPGAR